MRRTGMMLVGIAILAGCAGGAFARTAGPGIEIVIPKGATSPERIAAQELASHLSKLYPSSTFEAVPSPTGKSAFSVRLGTPVSAPDLAEKVGREKVAHPESYVVTTDGPATGVILGADPRGVMYGVYGLLEKLGCGFYLTCDTFPETLPGPFSLKGWDLSDRPLVRDRFVFNWHNFLSGCTGWNDPEWESWIVQSQKMGFNTIMVHVYGNNPSFTYTFNGITKQVGYYGTSRRGRDWGRQHINDVRRIPGGEIFDGPEFGSEAALVPDDKRIEAAQSFMKRIFGCAEKRGMDVCFALDVDTPSVLLQDMIETLPESARFRNGRKWLPKPDSPEGAAFFRAQVEALLKLYPEIDMLALWRRSHAAEWGVLKKPEQLPTEWRPEYKAIVAKHPGAEKLHQSVASFALNKVVGAFRKALDDLGRKDVRLGMGSWETSYVPALAVFLPEEVSIMPLDSSCMRYRRGFFFDVPAALADLKKAKGRIQPILWAHHDDGEYLGRPMKSHKNFCDILDELKARGYGIIHWMKRPLDLHFRNHEKQVWAASRNESCRKTCEKAARHWFGRANAEGMTRYLYEWWTKAPNFGRVTSNKLFLKKERIPDPEGTIRACQERLKMLAGADLAAMTTAQKSRMEYFKKLEEMIISFSKVQELAFRPAVEGIQKGDFNRAVELLRSQDPRDTMLVFSRLSQLDGGDVSEEAMILSMGTRWLTDYIAARQKAGLEPLRINFAPTRHEPLAQGKGKNTFFIDDKGDYWGVLGADETKRTIVSDGKGEYTSVRATGLAVDASVSLPLDAIASVSGAFRPGNYEAVLLLEGAGEGEAQLIGTGESSSRSSYSFSPVKARYLRLVCNGNSENSWNSIERVRISSLASGKPEKVVTASAAEKGYPATAVLDDKPESRWACQEKSWIQFLLEPEKETGSIGIRWYKGESRKPRFAIEVSDDGKKWKKVAIRGETSADRTAKAFSVEKGKPLEVKLSGVLKNPGRFQLQLKPSKGKPVLAGVVLRFVKE